jgi:hypothetical protein
MEDRYLYLLPSQLSNKVDPLSPRVITLSTGEHSPYPIMDDDKLARKGVVSKTSSKTYNGDEQLAGFWYECRSIYWKRIFLKDSWNGMVLCRTYANAKRIIRWAFFKNREVIRS